MRCQNLSVCLCRNDSNAGQHEDVPHFPFVRGIGNFWSMKPQLVTYLNMNNG